MEKRVLSIQSHVVSGYVGNKSAVFPLQILGFDVDSINTVQLSNHAAYPYFKGSVLSGEDLKVLCDGLAHNNLLHYSHLLTGYVGSLSFAEGLIKLFKDLREINPDIYIVCDPVLGDNGQMYVPLEILPIYRDHLIPLSDFITPNQYEAELLTGITINSLEDAKKAMQIFHDQGVETVVLSSARFKEEDSLTLLASSVEGGRRTLVKMSIPEIPLSFTGTGDLFVACMLAWLSKTNKDLKTSCEFTINTMQSVLKRTYSYVKEHIGPNEKATHKDVELKIIQSKEDIENPEIKLFATYLET